MFSKCQLRQIITEVKTKHGGLPGAPAALGSAENSLSGMKHYIPPRASDLKDVHAGTHSSVIACPV